MSIEQELASIKSKLDDLKTQKIESATRLQGLEGDKKKLLSECTKFGVDPKEINTAIASKEKDINDLVTNVKNGLEQVNVISA